MEQLLAKPREDWPLLPFSHIDPLAIRLVFLENPLQRGGRSRHGKRDEKVWAHDALQLHFMMSPALGKQKRIGEDWSCFKAAVNRPPIDMESCLW